MEKQEFITTLRQALTGRMDQESVMSHVSYYEDYINSQMRMGRSEEDVMSSLGDARMIAKTLLQTYDNSKNESQRNAYGSSSSSNYYEQKTTYDNQSNNGFGKYSIFNNLNNSNSSLAKIIKKFQALSVKLPSTLRKVIKTILVVAIIYLIFKLVAFLAPILIPIVIIYYVYRMLKK